MSFGRLKFLYHLLPDVLEEFLSRLPEVPGGVAVAGRLSHVLVAVELL